MKKDELYIGDIKHQADFILETLPKITRDELFESMLYQNALIRSLEVIGEQTFLFVKWQEPVTNSFTDMQILTWINSG